MTTPQWPKQTVNDPSTPYPSAWPKASQADPKALASRITEQQKADLYARKVTTRDLAATLKVSEAWLSHMFPGKVETFTNAKRSLLAARKEFRNMQAELVVAKKLKLHLAASVSRISYRSMARAVQNLKAQQKEPA